MIDAHVSAFLFIVKQQALINYILWLISYILRAFAVLHLQGALIGIKSSLGNQLVLTHLVKMQKSEYFQRVLYATRSRKKCLAK